VCAVKKDNYFGYIDNEGNDVIEFQYDFATSFKDQKALVFHKGKKILINKKGEYIEPYKAPEEHEYEKD
jgi:KWG Leptospira.